MLARSGRLPTSADYAYEVKWDGFRAIVSTEGPLRVRSRRGWNMTEHVRFLADLPRAASSTASSWRSIRKGSRTSSSSATASFLAARIDRSRSWYSTCSASTARNETAAVCEAPRDPRGPEPERSSLASARGVRRRRSTLAGNLRTRTRRSRRQASLRSLRPWGARLDQDEESRLLALRDRARGTIRSRQRIFV